MNPTPENEFLELRRLLALKRHEQPPPGYFNNLPREIRAQLKAQGQSATRRRDAESVPAWIARLLDRLQAQPGFAGACGALLCAVLIGTLVFQEGNGSPPTALPPLAAGSVAPATPAASERSGSLVQESSVFQPVTAESGLPLIASNDLPRRPSLFDSLPILDPATVDYR